MPVCSVTSSIPLGSAQRLGTLGAISPSPSLVSPGWAEGQAQAFLEAYGPQVGLDLPLTVWACSGHIIFLSLITSSGNGIQVLPLGVIWWMEEESCL